MGVCRVGLYCFIAGSLFVVWELLLFDRYQSLIHKGKSYAKISVSGLLHGARFEGAG
jgi:hypothetical protein